MELNDILSIRFTGQRVSAERSEDSPTGWCVTGWEQGLPICRKPIGADEVVKLCERFDYTITRL
jgi:hypothetical protein